MFTLYTMRAKPINAAIYKYLGTEITDKEENKSDGEEHSNSTIRKPADVLLSGGGVRFHTYYYKISFPLTFSSQEIELYRAYMKEIEWYEAQAKTAPSAQDVQRLNQERNNWSINLMQHWLISLKHKKYQKLFSYAREDVLRLSKDKVALDTKFCAALKRAK
jgi:hypothetical protein